MERIGGVHRLTKIFYVPIIPMEERYTAQWYRWFPKEFREAGYDVVVIDGGKVTNYKVGTGRFMDVFDGHLWEFNQIEKLVKFIKSGRIKDGDIIFFADIEFPGNVHTVKRLLKLLGKRTRCYGVLHAGSYTEMDFVSTLADSMKYLELSWLLVFDGIFVASNYHKRRILERRILPYGADFDKSRMENNIYVTGNPWYCDTIKKSYIKPREDRKIDVIISDRPDPEKRVDVALEMAVNSEARKIYMTTSRKKYRITDNIQRLIRNTDKEIVICEGLSKNEYYQILGNSKVYVTATIDENFGYCSVEAMTANTTPVMPNGFVFPEHVDGDRRFLYETFDEAVGLINNHLKSNIDVTNYPKKYENSIKKMIEVMERL